MENNIAFSIKGIDILNSIIKVPTVFRLEAGFSFDMHFNTSINLKDSIVSVNADVTVKENEASDIIGQFTAIFHYGVDNLEKLVTGKESNQPEIPKPLLTTLLGISVSTLRGLMFGTFKGTFLHNAILPVVDIAALQHELLPTSN